MGDIMYEYDGIKINYKDYGKMDGDAIVYLHGWGQNIQMMEPIADPFVETNRLIIIDLPGFGASQEPKSVWSVDEYVEMIHSLLESLGIKKPNIVGHSFGGKLSIVYASKYETKRIVLMASTYKVSTKKPSKKVMFLKKFKNVPILKHVANAMKKRMGSTDYRNATPRMRDILVKHLNTDVTDLARQIKCPSLIIWGTLDEAVPYEDGVELEKLIKDAGLVTYEGNTHYAYLERLNQTINVLKAFIK
jgi:pimeloyl-ACP methyl ester carboxylesterase